MMDIRIEGGQALIGKGLESTTIHLAPAQGVISHIGRDAPAPRHLDAEGLIVLPGIVDIHGDAFERQMMPRPGVHFAMDIALMDSDRQAVANGITTVFHGVTWSWEPGLRGPENARNVLTGIERLRPRLGADTRFHLRHETFNLPAEPEILTWLSERRIGLMAFNDHMLIADESSARSKKLGPMVERSGLSREAFLALVERVRERGAEVPGSIERIALAARAHGVPLLSHDDASPDQRRWFRALGCRLAEFPTTVETAEEAASHGDDIVLGAPNVVRGGSHIGWIDAKDMIRRGLCSVLASDYYYPAPLLAAFRLVAEEVLPLNAAWALISETAAAAAGLADRGVIAPGRRADLILVDARDERPRVVATIVGGRIVHLTEAERIGKD
ncbi:MAG TPA: alpha-D-ribose 1-methylphosphonate 5-triphosphate diphosphatase [Xanthobacteraceae bacterium]